MIERSTKQLIEHIRSDPNAVNRLLTGENAGVAFTENVGDGISEIVYHLEISAEARPLAVPGVDFGPITVAPYVWVPENDTRSADHQVTGS